MIGFLIGKLAWDTSRLWDHLGVGMHTCFVACLTAVCVYEQVCCRTHPWLCSLGHYEDGMCSLRSEASQKAVVLSNVESPREKNERKRIKIHVEIKWLYIKLQLTVKPAQKWPLHNGSWATCHVYRAKHHTAPLKVSSLIDWGWLSVVLMGLSMVWLGL